MTATDSVPPPVEQLPVHLTRFVGRERELDELARVIGTTRLLTLTGAGGSGKTRLAGETASRVAPSFQRVAWVDLAPLADRALVLQETAAALDVPERPDVSGIDRLCGAIGDASLLLVLDNCEHLVDACAELAEALLRRCPRLTVLATSREALGVPGETAWLVPPLASGEALQLFVERAQSALPAFALSDANAGAVREICRRLDGIPLAIELAAARVRAISPDEIAARLDDAFRLLTAGSRTALPRHRTLRGTMDWSYALLTEREQALLRRLAVFAGGFSLESAEAVCAGPPLEPDDILDGVAALVDKSLVVMESGEGTARYRLLETVRQYGVERLTEAGELAAQREAHARYFLAMAEDVAPLIIGGSHPSGIMARLGVEQDNLRAATLWAVHEAADAEIALRFADALFWFWYGAGHWLRQGQFNEARRFIDAALARPAAAHPQLRARALMAGGLTAHPQGDYELARDRFTEALALARSLDDPGLIAFAASKLAASYLMLHEPDRAWSLLEEADTLVRDTPPSVLHGFVGFWRIWTAHERGDLATARALGEQYVRMGHLVGQLTMIGHAHVLLGRVALTAGDLDAALGHLDTSLRTHLEIADTWGLGLDAEALAALAAARGRMADAVRLMGACDALRERVAIALPATDRRAREQRVAAARAALGDAYDRIYADGRALPLEEVAARLTADGALGLTAEHRVPAPEPEPASEPPTARALRVLALGPLQVLVGDVAIEPTAWGSARARELLVYLLMHPDGRTKEQVGLAFWPEASTAQLRNSFHVTLHRLRKALGDGEWITLKGERYRVSPELVAEFDAAEFERDVVAARRALGRREDGADAALERALARYRGDFLDGEPAGDWHVEHRDRFQRLYLDALMALGDRHVADERHARAAEAYRRVLARDELHEEALCALMKCHVRLGERAPALRLYQRFAARLRTELDAEPDDETTALYARLQQGASV